MKYHPQTHILLRPNLGVLQIGIKSQDFVMSNSEDSTATYMEVSSPFEDLSDIGSLGVDGLSMMLEEWKRISDKRTKNQAKTDKTGHGMERA
ncbi:hypothetical protein Tco_1421654 [Tanacetum coccineum]